MSTEIPTPNPEKKEILSDDNARKFTLENIDPEFLQENGAKSFLLTTDWLEMGEHTERKLAHKKYKDGSVKILLIQKFTDANGKRTVLPKQELTPEEYAELLGASKLRVTKERHEFDYTDPDGTTFSMKYDTYADSARRILEVDAETEAERNSFDPSEFPYNLIPVTENMDGYRVAAFI